MQNVYEEMASITLLSIPLFILKGSAIGRLARRPGPLRRAARLDAQDSSADSASPTCSPARCSPAMAGSSPATCSAIGSAGIPGDAQARLLGRLRGRHHRVGRHIGHPVAAIDHDDPLRGRGRAVAREALLRRHRAGAAAGQRRSLATRCGSLRASIRRHAGCALRPAGRNAELLREDTHGRRALLARAAAARAAVRDLCSPASWSRSTAAHATPSETAGLGAIAGARSLDRG